MNAPASRELDSAIAANNAEHRQYLTFVLGGEMFAIGILAIKEIIEYGEVTSVPMMPRFVRGVINLRGAVVPVMDLSARFGRSETKLSKRTCIVIVEVESASGANAGRQDMGVMVDAVNAVLEIADAQIEPAPVLGAKLRTEFIRGMGKVDGKFVILLDVNRVLSGEEIAGIARSDMDAGTDAGMDMSAVALLQDMQPPAAAQGAKPA
jgi:purine-binding chemotaxis protein CheW